MPYLVTGLRSFQAHQLCMVSVGVVVDICAAVGGQIQPFCDQIVGALTDCLKDGSAHRDTKPVVFSCFGDVAMAIGASFEPYLQVASMLLMQASQAQMQLDDDELVDFINRLRLSVLDAYTGIIMGLADGHALQFFVPNVSNVMQFLQFLSTPESYKDDMCLQKAVALVGDIAQQMGSDPRIRQQINQPFVAQLVQEAGTSSNEATRELATWTQGVVRETLSNV
jgi:importin subunit beta-1